MQYTAGEPASRFMFPSAVDAFKRQFAYLEGGGQPISAAGSAGASRELRRQAQSLPREQMVRALCLCARRCRTDARGDACRSTIATRRQSTWRARTPPAHARCTRQATESRR